MNTRLLTRAPKRTTVTVVVVAALVVLATSVVLISTVLAAQATPTPTITSSPANPTNVTSASFSFTDSAPQATFECALDAAAFSACTTPKTYPGPLASGDHTFHVRAQKSNFTVSSEATYTWRVDTTAPTVATIAPSDANPAKAGPLHWTVTFNEPVRNVATSNFGLVTSGLSGTAPTVSSVAPVGTAPVSAWTVTVASSGSTAVSGSIRLDLVAKGTIADAAGNALGGTVPVAGQAYGYDTTAPTITSINRADANPAKSGSLHWTATFGEAVSNVAVSNFGLSTSGVTGSSPTVSSVAPVGSAPAGTWTITVVTPGAIAANGTIGLNLVAKGTISDAAGNLLGGSVPVAGQVYNFDSVAPAVTLTKVNGATTSFPLSTTANVTALGGACGTAAGDSSSVNVSITGSSIQSAAVACTGAGTWSYSTSPTLSAEGTYRATATQLDTAGNTGSSGERTVVIDRTPPPAPIFTNTPPTATDKTNAQFNWYDSEQVGSYQCGLDGAGLTSCAASGVEFKNLAVGNHCLRVVAIDLAGNVSAPNTFCWTVTGLAFGISGGATQPLYPGGPALALDLSISNPNNFAIRVSVLTAAIQSETLNGTCTTGTNFSAGHGLLVPVVIAAYTTASLSALGVAASDRPQIQMVETHLNQDACRGVTIHLNYSGSADRV